MHMFTVLILLAALAAVLVVLVQTVREDGYGVRPPPRSHYDEVDA